MPHALQCFALTDVCMFLQVAAQAEHHIVVRKAVDAEGRALTRFAVLTEEAERAEEVGAMLGLGSSEARQMMQAASPSFG